MANVEVTLANYETVYGLEVLADEGFESLETVTTKERHTATHHDTVSEFGTGESYYTK